MKLAAILTLCLVAQAETMRDARAVLNFRRATVCPSTGQKSDKCPGYVVDHIIPLCTCRHDRKCLDILDKPANMQYQSVEAAKAKDRIEVSSCRAASSACQMVVQ